MVVSMINLKGGVGKTTTAIALATAAAREGLDVEVYDADPQSSASLWATAAEEAGDPLPFPVSPANVATVRKAAGEWKGVAGRWLFIDCPPNGRVVDEAADASDLVVIPTTTGPADLAKTFETADTLESRGTYSSVLLTKTLAKTLSLRGAVMDLEERDASYFDTQIPSREALKSFFANSFGTELFGYEGVWEEVKGALADAS